MSKQLTIRGVSDQVGERLKLLSRSKGQSVNSTVLQIIEAAVGVGARRQRLERYVTWSPEQLEEFERHLTAQRRIDEELWS